MARSTSWARAADVEAISRRAAKRIAALAVTSESPVDTAAEVDRASSIAASAAPESATPRRVERLAELLPRRASRLPSVPIGQPRRVAAWSSVRPSK